MEGKKEEALALTRNRVDVYCLLGMKDEALARFKEAIATENYVRRVPYLAIKNYPPYDCLRKETAYIQFEREIKAKYDDYVQKFTGVVTMRD